MEIRVKTLFAGSGEGPLLSLTSPLSFWGGVCPDTGKIINTRHAQAGCYLGGVVVYIPELIGSSSSSAVMLELIRGGHAPNAIVLGKSDAILVVGCLVARELGYQPPPVVEATTWPFDARQESAFCVEAENSHIKKAVVRQVV